MTDELLQALDETKESLLDEAQDQLRRVEALDWEILEKHFREKEGYNDEMVAIEKRMFDSLQERVRSLADER